LENPIGSTLEVEGIQSARIIADVDVAIRPEAW